MAHRLVKALILIMTVLLTVPLSLKAQEADTSSTPRPEDIPEPVAGETALAGSERPDITRFLNVRSAGRASLAPDGERVAFSTQITGKPQLWAVSRDGGWPTQLTFGESVTFHEWSPAGDWIVYGVDRGGNEREGFYLISPEGTEERELLAPSDAFRQFGAFTSDGSRIVYATTARNGQDFDIHILDVETGDDRRVFEGRMGLYAQAFRPDGGAVLLTEARGEDANNVYLYDVAASRLDTLFNPEDRAAYESFAWVSDGSGFYMATNHERDYAGLAYYDTEQDSLSFIETPDAVVEQVALSADDRYLAWSTNEGGYSMLHVRDLLTGEMVAAPDLPRGVYRLTWANDAPVAAIEVSGPQVPGDIWTWQLPEGTLSRATYSSSAGLDLSSMIVPEHVSFPARDGETLRGLLYLPDSTAMRLSSMGDRPPVVLAVHGGPTAQARPSFERDIQYLLTRGVAVLDLNYRGSTGYGKRFAQLNDGRLRENELNDLVDALRWLESDTEVDASRAAIMGGSYGGYLTMAAVTRLSEHFDAGVTFVGVANWLTALEGASPQLKASDRVEYGDIDDPDDRAFFKQISPINHTEQAETPVMVLHGANDPRVPVGESDQFVEAIRDQGGEVEYLRFPDEGHGIRKLSNRIIAYRRIAQFLERHLQPAGADNVGGATESSEGGR